MVDGRGLTTWRPLPFRLRPPPSPPNNNPVPANLQDYWTRPPGPSHIQMTIWGGADARRFDHSSSFDRPRIEHPLRQWGLQPQPEYVAAENQSALEYLLGHSNPSLPPPPPNFDHQEAIVAINDNDDLTASQPLDARSYGPSIMPYQNNVFVDDEDEDDDENDEWIDDMGLD